jgi:cytochrome c oxidase subunit 1
MTISAERSADNVGTSSSQDGGVRAVSWTQRPGVFSQHAGTAALLAVLGYLFGHWFGNYLVSGYDYVQTSGQNSIANTLALAFGVVGWLAGIGALNHPLAKLIGKDALEDEASVDNWTKYFRYTLDHKVVGVQYVVGVLLFMFTGGLLAMAVRAELLNPTSHLFSPGTYIEIVSEHGTVMMMMATSIVVGPLGNYFVPLMIGARRMAFPRIEAMSFWIFTAGYLVIFSALPYGGFPTGWTG